jgi:3-oxoacyl-(acyl-carrier-protein) synthase
VRKPDYSRRVVVTGMGVVSPIGNDLDTVWANLVNGRSGIGEITHFDTTPYEHKAGGEVHDFDVTKFMELQGRPPDRDDGPLRRRLGQAWPWPTPAWRSPTTTATTSA